jgi:hypothetical protein
MKAIRKQSITKTIFIMFSPGITAEKLQSYKQDRTKAFAPKIKLNDLRKAGGISNEEITAGDSVNDFVAKLLSAYQDLNAKLVATLDEINFLFPQDSEKLKSVFDENVLYLTRLIAEEGKKNPELSIREEEFSYASPVEGTKEFNWESEWKKQLMNHKWYLA